MRYLHLYHLFFFKKAYIYFLIRINIHYFWLIGLNWTSVQKEKKIEPYHYCGSNLFLVFTLLCWINLASNKSYFFTGFSILSLHLFNSRKIYFNITSHTQLHIVLEADGNSCFFVVSRTTFLNMYIVYEATMSLIQLKPKRDYILHTNMLGHNWWKIET